MTRSSAERRQAADRELAPGFQRRADDLGIGFDARQVHAGAAHRRLCYRLGGRHAGERQQCHAGRSEIRGRQAVLHCRPRPRRPDRARPQFLRGPAELAAAKAHHPDAKGRRDRARSVQSQRHAVESGGRLVRGRLRAGRRTRRHGRRSSAAPTCSACSWTATTCSGCHRPRACGCRTASPVSPACPRARRSRFWRRTACAPATANARPGR